MPKKELKSLFKLQELAEWFQNTNATTVSICRKHQGTLGARGTYMYPLTKKYFTIKTSKKSCVFCKTKANME
jgi:hypothetical protein